MLRWIALFGLVACEQSSVVDVFDTDPADATDSGPADTDEGPDSETSPDLDTDSGISIEERSVRSLIAGESYWDTIIPIIGDRSGFPVQTETGWIVVVKDRGTAPMLAGDFNAWTPEAMIAADGLSDGLYWAEIQVSDPAGIRYKFVYGDDWSADALARSYDYDENGQFSYLRPPADKPRLDRYFGVSGVGMNARELRVYVPAGTGPWPTLYMHDGQNLFDPEGMGGGWKMREVVNALDTPILVVGIDNTELRMQEYTPVSDEIEGVIFGALGDYYAGYLHDVVRPLVHDRYGTTGHDGLLGSSLGGLISLYIGLRYPDDYDFVGSMSGTLGWGKFTYSNPTIGEMYLDAEVQPFVVYADSGGDSGASGCTDPDNDGVTEDDPDDSDNYCVTREFVDDLFVHGYTWDANLYHWYAVGAGHNEAAWSARVEIPLGIFLDPIE